MSFKATRTKMIHMIVNTKCY